MARKEALSWIPKGKARNTAIALMASAAVACGGGGGANPTGEATPRTKRKIPAAPTPDSRRIAIDAGKFILMTNGPGIIEIDPKVTHFGITEEMAVVRRLGTDGCDIDHTDPIPTQGNPSGVIYYAYVKNNNGPSCLSNDIAYNKS